MEAEKGKYSHLTKTGMAVVKRLIQSNRESLLAATGPLGISATEQSEIIRKCHEKCVGLVADSLNGTPGATVSVGEASKHILDTLLILQDDRPPPSEQLCLGLSNGLPCGQQITRIRIPWAIHLHNLDVTVRLRRPAGSYVVTAISMFPGIRLCNHPRLCDEHEEIMNGMLKNVLLSEAFRDRIIDTSDEIPTGFHRNSSWTMSTGFVNPGEAATGFRRNRSDPTGFINPDEDTEMIMAFVNQSVKFLSTRPVACLD